MSDLLAARSQMAVSLAFHIVFAVIGIAMPLMMVLAERRWQVTGHAIYLDLGKRWAKGTAILFAVGAVSGTVLSFELGLLWPKFMEFAGPIIGMPFSLEGFAFFTEAIFLGIYLYGWDRISPGAHLAAGGIVALSGAASGVFVVVANAWMNAPAGFELVNGQAVDCDRRAATRGSPSTSPPDCRASRSRTPDRSLRSATRRRATSGPMSRRCTSRFSSWWRSAPIWRWSRCGPAGAPGAVPISPTIAGWCARSRSPRRWGS